MSAMELLGVFAAQQGPLRVFSGTGSAIQDRRRCAERNRADAAVLCISFSVVGACEGHCEGVGCGHQSAPRANAVFVQIVNILSSSLFYFPEFNVYFSLISSYFFLDIYSFFPEFLSFMEFV